MDVREFLPNITNDDVKVLRYLSCHEWAIARRLYRASISKGKTIERKDLRQAFPSDKLDQADAAINSLVKKGILMVTPKPTAQNFHLNRDFFNNDIVVSFLDKITEDRKLKEALVEDELVFSETSDLLRKVIDDYFDRHGNKRDYSIRASNKKAHMETERDKLGLILEVTIECHNHKSFTLPFEILCANDLFESDPITILCECGEYHACVACGIILYSTC